MTEIQAENNQDTQVSKEELDGMMEMIRYLLDAYGTFAEKIGTIQRDHKNAYEAMMSPTSMMQVPEMLNKLSEKNQELSNLLTKIFLKMSTCLPQVANLMNLNAEDKIKLGKNLKSLARDIDTLLDMSKVKVE